MFGDYFKLAFRNLKHRGIRSWLTLLGIFIGVLAVISLVSLGTGLKTAVASQFCIGTTEVISVQAGGISDAGPPGTGVTKFLTYSDADAIERLSTVEAAITRIITSGKLEYNYFVGFGYAASIPDGDKRDLVYEILDINPEVGRLLKDGDTNKVVLGYNFLKEDNGFGKPIVPGKTVLIQDKEFEVVGITEKEGSFIFDNLVYMNEEPLKDLMNYGERVDIIAVKVRDKDFIGRAKTDIEKLMRARRNVEKGEEDFEVSTPETSLETVNSILGGVQAFIIVVASISILVGAIGIVNTMTTSVLERRREIGIMKSIGARNLEIFNQFLIESGLLGFVGGFLGVIGGLVVGYLGIQGLNNFIGSEISLDLNYFLIIGSLIGSFIIGAVSGIIPALQAAKQNPVEALRG